MLLPAIKSDPTRSKTKLTGILAGFVGTSDSVDEPARVRGETFVAAGVFAPCNKRIFGESGRGAG